MEILYCKKIFQSPIRNFKWSKKAFSIRSFNKVLFAWNQTIAAGFENLKFSQQSLKWNPGILDLGFSILLIWSPPLVLEQTTSLLSSQGPAYFPQLHFVVGPRNNNLLHISIQFISFNTKRSRKQSMKLYCAWLHKIKTFLRYERNFISLFCLQ